MTEYTISANLNAPTTVAKAVKILLVTSRSNIERAPRTRCAKCHSQVLLGPRKKTDLFDLNHKRHVCESADRIFKEEECVIELQQILEYYNRYELSSFQLRLKMDD